MYENLVNHKQRLSNDGYTVLENIFTKDEVSSIVQAIDQTNASSQAFRKTKDLFAIRRFLKEVPAVQSLIFNGRLKGIINELFGKDYFVVKSIYFDKPQESNWFVSYHQDLTIAVQKKVECDGFSQWTVKQDQFSVQPPVDVLANIFTIRIHLDDTDENNGALKVIPGSHLKGICRPETIDWAKEREAICNVNSGGIMIMRPLLLHASSRTTNNRKRRVIHIEFSNLPLPGSLEWAELFEMKENLVKNLPAIK